MQRMTLAALASLVGFAVSIVLYSYFPFPGDGTRWEDPELWVSLLLLIVGLVSFVVLLVTGLITVLNRGTERPPSRPP